MADDSDNVVGGVSVRVGADLTDYRAGMAQAKAETAQFDQDATRQLGNVSKATAELTMQQKSMLAALIQSKATLAEGAAAIGKSVDQQNLLAAFTAHVTAATKESAKATKDAARSAEQLAQRANALRAAIDPLGAAQAKLAKATKEAADLQRLGAITSVEAEAATKLAQRAFDKTAHALRAVGGATSTVTREFLVLGREGLRGNWTRMAGSATILAQAMGLLGFLLSPVGIAILAVTGAIVGLAIATEKENEAQTKLSATLAGVGAASGQSSAAINKSAQEAAAASGVTRGAALASAESFAEAGVRSRAVIEQLSGAVREYAALTGEKAAAANKELAGAMRDPIKGAEELHDKIGILDAAQLQQIDTLVKFGDKEGAVAIITKALTDRTNEAAAAGIGLQGSWSQLAGYAVGLVDVLSKVNTQLELFQSYGFASGTVQAAAQAKQAAGLKVIQDQARTNQETAAAYNVAKDTPEGRERSHFEELEGQRAILERGMAAEQRQGHAGQYQKDAAALGALNDTIKRVTDSTGHYITAAEREHQILGLTVQMTEATKKHDAALRGRLETQIALLKVGDTVETDAQAQQHAADEGAVATARGQPSAKKPKKDIFGNQQRSIEADAAGELALAAAYLESDGAAIRADASRKALTETTRAGRTAAQQAVDAQHEINLAFAKSVTEGAKVEATTLAEAHALEAANAAVLSGSSTRAQASLQMAEDLKMRPLLAAYEEADAATKKAAKPIIDALTAAQRELNAAKGAEIATNDVDKQRDELEILKLQLTLVGATARVRDAALAKAREAQSLGISDTSPATPEQTKAIQGAGDVAGARSDLAGVDFMQQQKESFDDATRTLLSHTSALKADTAAQEAARLVAEALSRAEKSKIELSPADIAALNLQADAYAKLDKAVEDYQTRQKSLQATNKQLTDSIESSIEGLIDHTTTLKKVGMELARTAEHDVLKATLSGEGPMAGLFGTAQGQSGQGGALGMGANAIEGLLGIGGKGAGKPTGSASDPIYTRSVDQSASTAGGGISSIMGSLGGFGAGGDLGFSSLGSGGVGAGGSIGPIVPQAFNATGIDGLSSPFGGAGGIQSLLSGLAGGVGKLAGSAGSAAGGLLSSLFGAGASSAVGPGAMLGDMTSLVGLLHTGTSYVGTPSATRAVSPSLFLNAPRLHSGLAPDEFPAILQRGEGVTPKGANGAQPKRGDFHMHVHGATDNFSRSAGQMSRSAKRSMQRA